MSSATAPPKPVRKFPPPCWTRDEALVLIEAYRERWHALHRAFLRTPDWDAVAEKVTTSCPDVIPPKTSAQCRHKMEKLRQRYRAEKQRASAFSGERFFSSWFYFDAMEAMENGSNSEPGSNPINSITPNHQSLNSGRGIRIKPSSVHNLVTLATSSTKNKKSSPNLSSRVSNRYNDDEDRNLIETPIEETSIPIAYRRSKIHKTCSTGVKSSMNLETESRRRGLRPRKSSKVVYNDGDNGEMRMQVSKSRKLVRGMNQKKKKKNGGLSEMVSSIRLLGDGFMKMEKMKIEMAREIEKMRMESELKRNELILESQKQIVDAFVKGLMEPTTMAGGL